MRKVFTRLLEDEKGSVAQMVWVIGAAVVTGLVLFAAMVFAPDTAQQLWTRMTGWLTGNLGI
ncbi:MAG: hypothetical protein C4575_01975 [Desulforudis sp.]|nr:MAG: hypothetical protein C4575_01975 [Desulforudis sp.]